MRLHDWSERLSAVFVDARGTAFSYGAHDCCTFAADCILAVTGRDVADAWRGQYRSARRGLKLAGVATLAELAGRHLPEIHPAFAARGDIGLIAVPHPKRPNRTTEVLVVFDGGLLRSTGEQAFARHMASRAWRVA